MALETGSFISDLIATNPTGTDPRNQGDDHIRLVKSVLKSTFPNVTGAMLATQVELNILDGALVSTAELNILSGATLTTAELNFLDGVTSAVQTQLDSKLAISNKATQVQAEAGTDDVAYMTALKTLQSITANASSPPAQTQTVWNTGTDTTESIISAAKLDAKVKTRSLGDGQTWQNLTASRSGGVTYTNSTGRTIYVSASGTSGSVRLSMVVNGITVQSNGENDTPGNGFGGVCAVVPNGSTYSVTVTTGSVTQWAELR